MGVSALGSLAACRVLRVVPAPPRPSITPAFWVRSMVPVGFFHALTLCLGNTVYLYLAVSFIQMLKAFTPVLTLTTLSALSVETFSRRAGAAVCVITFGTFMAGAGALDGSRGSLVGVGVMLAAEMAEVMRLVLTQKLLTNLKFPAMEGLYYMAPICTCWMWGVGAMTELPKAFAAGNLAIVSEHAHTFALAAALGFTVNLASFLVIKRTNSIMLKLLGTARNAGLVLFSATFLGEQITQTQARTARASMHT